MITTSDNKSIPNILIIYHANCMDGAGSLYVTHKSLKELYPDARIISQPCAYPDRDLCVGTLQRLAELNLPEDTYDAIYVVDFSFTPKQFQRLCTIATEVSCIDHHKTACDTLLYPGNRDLLPSNLHLVLDVNNSNSGAILCHKYFNGADEVPSSVLRYIEDRDLWKFQLPDSKAVNTWLHAHVSLWSTQQEQLIKDMQYCMDVMEVEPHTVLQQGRLLLDVRMGYVADIANQAVVHTETNIVSCNCPHVFASDVAELLRKRYPNMAMFMLYQVANGELRVSFRAGTEDVMQIAQDFGGGGHDKAAGATVSVHSWFEYLEAL